METNPEINPEGTKPVELPAVEPAAPAVAAEPVIPEVLEEPVKPEGIEEPVVEPVISEPEKGPAKKSFSSKLLPWAIVALIFFAGGISLIYFTVYKAANATIATANEKISTLTQELDQANSAADVEKAAADKVRSEMDAVKSELTAAQATITEQETAIANGNKARLAYKFLLDVNAARLALEKKDISTARQTISFAKADLQALQATDLASSALSGFSDLLSSADLNLNETELIKSRSALDTLYTNLLMLTNNLP